ncbi:TPA: hypothetical protein DDY55_04285 [Candidatus Falkowbacteria bacterium]|nr:hypothetical protein [Candidatus Falkowbacteria bacterium]HAY12144.1 hypothetical protein [Candidatus Falkowbacteria bacterium]HBI97305.1 hypothetical protein [Candidatus Falkowbacteria bacterium]HBT28048.1 hypothetical protein [Candidatus Falkowbacteria bacterium]HBY14512.1 hypothetical protein [Candidatus Falkowbacteria bacterium]
MRKSDLNFSGNETNVVSGKAVKIVSDKEGKFFAVAILGGREYYHLVEKKDGWDERFLPSRYFAEGGIKI